MWNQAILLLFTVLAVSATAADPASDAGAAAPARVVYKSVGDVELRLHVFKPSEANPGTSPAIVFFFGGGWTTGRPEQFYEQCKYFASRGAVGISAEYRVKQTHGVSPMECVRDAKSAIRYVRAHAAELGVDPNKIVAAGGSAGGHLAACTAVIEGLDEENEDKTVSSRSNALVLFNPAVEIPESGRAAERFQGHAAELSPIRHVKKGEPPTIIFHGTADTTVPFNSVERFRDAMKKEGNTCELVPFEGKKHGFFNFARDRESFDKTVRAADHFLVSQGLLRAPDAPQSGTSATERKETGS